MPKTSKIAARRRFRAKDPVNTRELMLKAAREVFAEDGKEGLFLAEVARRAGVDRSTAYTHFQTREQLADMAAASISRQLHMTVFGDPEAARDQPIETVDVEAVVRHLSTFAMENPVAGRVWLFEWLSSEQPAKDPFWQRFNSNFERFSKTDLAQPNIDIEVVTVLLLAGLFVWPVWVENRVSTVEERQQMIERLTNEILRLCLHGTVRPQQASRRAT